MDVAELQKRIDAIPWYHEFDFGNGLRAQSKTPDIDLHRRFWRFIQEGLEAVDFKNKTVLDVGCWDGYWSFYAERRGAKSVLALDDFSQNWANEKGLLLAKELLGSNVQTKTNTSVYDVASLGQKFDIVLLLGVYYHLLDPFYGFAQLRHCCHSGTIICIEGNESIGLPDNTAGFNAGHASNKFYPTNGYLRQLLETTYFSVSDERFLEPVNVPPRLVTPQWRYRMCRKAAFGSESDIRKMATQLILPQSERLQMLRRAFFTCGVFEGENPLHMYRPPFGLDAYDPRFSARPSNL